MAYDITNLAKLGHLKSLAERIKADYATKAELGTLQDQVEGLVTAGGEPNKLEGVKVNGTALAIAEKMVDILIATGTANGTVAVNNVDVAVKGLAALAYKAQISEADLDTALKAALDAKASGADVATLIGTDTGKSVRTIANEELAAQLIAEGAQESLDTLAEIAAWIQAHPGDAAAMNAAITALQAVVDGLGTDEGDSYTTVIAAIDAKIAAALAGISDGATKVEASETNGNIKIDGAETPVYVHPTTTEAAAAFRKVGNDAAGHVVLGDAITKEDITGLGIPAQDTTYTAATQSAAGLMSSADKTKLDGMELATDEEVTAMLDEVFGATV